MVKIILEEETLEKIVSKIFKILRSTPPEELQSTLEDEDDNSLHEHVADILKEHNIYINDVNVDTFD